MVGPVTLGDYRRQRWIPDRFRIDARFRRKIRRLENHVRFMITVTSIHRPDDRELVQHCSLLRQMLTNYNARQFGFRDTKWTSINPRTIRLTVPGIDVTWTTGHP